MHAILAWGGEIYEAIGYSFGFLFLVNCWSFLKTSDFKRLARSSFAVSSTFDLKKRLSKLFFPLFNAVVSSTLLVWGEKVPVPITTPWHDGIPILIHWFKAPPCLRNDRSTTFAHTCSPRLPSIQHTIYSPTPHLYIQQSEEAPSNQASSKSKYSCDHAWACWTRRRTEFSIGDCVPNFDWHMLQLLYNVLNRRIVGFKQARQYY